MQFQATEDQLMVQQMVRRFVTEQVTPLAATLAHADAPLSEVLGATHELGLRGARARAEDFGSEMDAISDTFIIEELSRGDLGLGLMLAHHNLGTMILSMAEYEHTGDFITQQSWLGVCITDDTALDADDITLTLDFVPAGCKLTHYLLMGTRRAVLIDLSDEHVDVIPSADALGLRATSPAKIVLKQAPATHTFDHTTSLLHTARIAHHIHHAAAAVGLAQAAYDVSAAYAYERKQFRRRLTEFQVTQFKLANMATRLQCARHMCYLAATRSSRQDSLLDALNAHAFAVKAASYIADEGVQLHGGYGYTSEYPIERYYRDAVALQALGGGLHHAQRRAGALFLEQSS